MIHSCVTLWYSHMSTSLGIRQINIWLRVPSLIWNVKLGELLNFIFSYLNGSYNTNIRLSRLNKVCKRNEGIIQYLLITNMNINRMKGFIFILQTDCITKPKQDALDWGAELKEKEPKSQGEATSTGSYPWCCPQAQGPWFAWPCYLQFVTFLKRT